MPASLGYYPPGLTWLPPSLLPFPSFVPLLPPFFAFPSSRPGSRLSPTPIHKRDVWTRMTDPFNTCLCEVLAWLLLPQRRVQGKQCLGLRIPLLGSSRVWRVVSHTGAFGQMREAPFLPPLFSHSHCPSLLSPWPFNTPHSFYNTFPHFITPSPLHLSCQASLASGCGEIGR